VEGSGSRRAAGERVSGCVFCCGDAVPSRAGVAPEENTRRGSFFYCREVMGCRTPREEAQYDPRYAGDRASLRWNGDAPGTRRTRPLCGTTIRGGTRRRECDVRSRFEVCKKHPHSQQRWGSGARRNV